ncbi:hypothetical protein ACFPGO_01120 [Arcanobacterium canis]|uniref:Uncharacterized protein n=1 Tax=Arcanobacterium canis TaxID=999183 RepID=A0ABY8FW35_9ACTO|nr:hypothetical protein [Arcanobacterium canis]WFM82731.1 hypothetical protein P7079_04805 [Arcanobacterium canis]
MSKGTRTRTLMDNRTRSWGWPIALMGVLALGSIIFTWRAILAGSHQFVHGDVFGATTTFVAALAWVFGTAGLIHNGRKMRRVAWACWILNAVGTVWGIAMPHLFCAVSPWQMAGRTYYFLPAIGTVCTLLWLVWSDPARVAARGH